MSTRFSTRLILGGHEMAREPLDDLGREAVEIVASTLESPGMCRDFQFEPGQIQILNNRRLGHRRTAFKTGRNPSGGDTWSGCGSATPAVRSITVNSSTPLLDPVRTGEWG